MFFQRQSFLTFMNTTFLQQNTLVCSFLAIVCLPVCKLVIRLGFASFQTGGKYPCSRERLKTTDKGNARMFDFSFNRRARKFSLDHTS